MTFHVKFLLGSVLATFGPNLALAASPNESQQVQTGVSEDSSRSFLISLNTALNGRSVKPVIARLDGMTLTGLDSRSLTDALSSFVSDDVAQLLRNAPPITSVSELGALGISAVFDPKALQINIELPANFLRTQRFDLLGSLGQTDGELVDPANISAGLTGVLAMAEREGSSSQSLNLRGFANVGGKKGVYFLAGGDVVFGSGNNFERDRILAFHDDVGSAVRYSVGDISFFGGNTTGPVEIGGVSISKSFQELQPFRNIRPTGSRSFVVDEPSRIEIIRNGAIIAEFDVDPGAVDLSNIAGLTGTSNISVFVEDQFGRRELENFVLSGDLSILAKGVAEYNLAAGVKRDFRGGRFSYGDDLVASGTYRLGITDRLTGEASVGVSEDIQNVGAGGTYVLSRGVVGIGVGVSNSDQETGGALFLEYRGAPNFVRDRNDQLNVRAQFESKNFLRLQDTFGFSSIKYDVGVDYRFDLSDTVSLTTGGSAFKLHDQEGSTNDVFLGAQFLFGATSAGITARYLERADTGGELGFFLNLSRPLGRRHNISGSVDTLTNSSRVDFRRRRSFGLPEFDYAASYERFRDREAIRLRSRYANSRFLVDGDLSQGFGGVQNDAALLARLQSGIAFADGSFAVGRDPASGFTLVRRSGAVADEKVDVLLGNNQLEGQANAFGPAVVRQNGQYRPVRLRLNVRGDNPFLNIGSGEYIVSPGAVSGTLITVDSSTSQSMRVQLIDDSGAPISLRTGILRRTGAQDRSLFTNRTGFLFLQELEPGTYTITFEDLDIQGRFTVSGEDGPYFELPPIILETIR